MMADCCLMCVAPCDTEECSFVEFDITEAMNTVCLLLNVAFPDSASKVWSNIPLCKPCSVDFFLIYELNKQILSIQCQIGALLNKFRSVVLNSEKKMRIPPTKSYADDRVLDFRVQLIEDLRFRNWEGVTKDLEPAVKMEYEDDEPYLPSESEADDSDFVIRDSSRKNKLSRLLKRSKSECSRNSEPVTMVSYTRLTRSQFAAGKVDETRLQKSSKLTDNLMLRSRKSDLGILNKNLDKGNKRIQKNINIPNPDAELIISEDEADDNQREQDSDDSIDDEDESKDNDSSWEPEVFYIGKRRDVERDLARKSENDLHISNNSDFVHGDDGKLFYKDKEILLVEISRSSGSKFQKYGCSLCPKDFFLISKLQSHLQLHLGVKSHKLPFWKVTDDGRFFYGDIEYFYDQSEEFPYKCSICSKSYFVKESLQPHLEKHWDVFPFYCQTCGMGFSSEVKQRNHQKRDCGFDPLCDICGKRLKNRENLYIHRRSHRGEAEIAAALSAKMEKADVSCLICSKHFKQRGNLKVHMKTHTGSVSKYIQNKFQCLYCGKRFPREENLKEHEEVVHFQSKVISCEEEGCGKTFVSESGKRYHKVRVHGIGTMDYSCSICMKKFPAKVELRKHISAAHDEGVGRIQCPHCDKKFVHMYNLVKHSAVHSDLKKFECKYCDKSYKGKHNLQKHMFKRHPEVDKLNYF